MTVFFLGFISLFCCQGYYFDNKGTLLPEITKSALIPGGLEFLILFRHPKLFYPQTQNRLYAGACVLVLSDPSRFWYVCCQVALLGSPLEVLYLDLYSMRGYMLLQMSLIFQSSNWPE